MAKKEVMMTNKTKIESSPRKVTVTDIADPKEVDINHLSELAINQEVSLTIKVISVGLAEKVNKRVGSELSKQDVIVGDATGCTRVVLCENDAW